MMTNVTRPGLLRNAIQINTTASDSGKQSGNNYNNNPDQYLLQQILTYPSYKQRQTYATKNDVKEREEKNPQVRLYTL